MTAQNRLAVLGSPIEHSKSPALHRAAYEVLGLDWSYEAAEVDSAGLADYIASRDGSWRGLSLTMPLKQTVLPLLDSIDSVAELTGAANTVLFDGEALRGFNTDVTGIVRALEAAGLSFVSSVQILGGGATAASALVAAVQMGAEGATVLVRSPERAETLQPLASELELPLEIRHFDDARHAADLVISTLPGGVETSIPASDSFLLDVAYSHWPSAIAGRWIEAGNPVLSGLAMLVHQALIQVRIFVSGDANTPLNDESAVLSAMLATVGLDRSGRPVS